MTKSMNSFERVMNTIKGLPVDRVPVFAVLGAYGGKISRNDLRTLYTDASAYISGQQCVYDTFGFDLILAPFDYSAIAEAFGGEAVFFPDQPPNVKRPVAHRSEEALDLPLPDPRTAARLPFILEAVRKLAKIYKDEVPVFAAIPGPCSMPVLLLGMERWMEIMLFEESTAQKILDFTGIFFTSWANALLESGATALIMTEGIAAAEITTRKLFAERLRPHLRTILAGVKGPMVFHHTGGIINHIIDMVPGLPNVIGVSVGCRDDLARRGDS